jgi:hypothetical protein
MASACLAGGSKRLSYSPGHLDAPRRAGFPEGRSAVRDATCLREALRRRQETQLEDFFSILLKTKEQSIDLQLLPRALVKKFRKHVHQREAPASQKRYEFVDQRLAFIELNEGHLDL